MIPKKHPPIFSVLMLGILSQVGQVLILRELLMVFQGSELSIGIILASWMIWVGIGSFFGGAISGRSVSSSYWLKLTAGGVVVALPVTIILIRHIRGFFDVVPGGYLSLSDMLMASLTVMAPLCILVGSQFVFLAALWRESANSKGAFEAGKTYFTEAAGNMLGGMLFTFFLVRYFTPLQSAFFIAAIMLLAAFFSDFRERSISRYMIPGLLVFMFVLSPFLRSLDKWAYRVQWKDFTPEHSLVEIYHSKHGAISVVERKGQYTFFQSGNMVFSTAGAEAVMHSLEDQDAVTFAHFALLQHKNPKRILLIGGGLRGTLYEIAKYPVYKIDYVELDEVLTKAATPYISRSTINTLKDPRVNHIHTDGRLFLKKTEEKYDMVIIDVPDPLTAVLNRFYTLEFFKEAREVLASDGVFVSGVVSTPDLRGVGIANRNASLYHSLKDVFPNVAVAGERFMFYFASEESRQISVDFHELQERFHQREVEVESFSPHYIYSMLQPSQLNRINWIVRNHGREKGSHTEPPSPGPVSPGSLQEQREKLSGLPDIDRRYFINSDFKPVGYYYTLMFWEQLTRAGESRVFERLIRIDLKRTAPFLVLPVLLVILLKGNARLYKKNIDTGFAILYAVFTTGFSTMALQIALIFSFQNIYGFIYEIVGIIIAFFMCGLALGTGFSNRFIKDKSNLKIISIVQIVIATVSVSVAIIIPAAAGIRSSVIIFIIFSLVTFFSGLVNGVDYPLGTAALVTLGWRPEKSASVTYGVELMGACIGAVAASAFIVPVMGVRVCCYLAGVAGLTAFVVLFISRRLSE